MAILSNKELTALLMEHIANCQGTGSGSSSGGTIDVGVYTSLLNNLAATASTLVTTLPAETLLAPSVAGVTLTADNAWSMFIMAIIDAVNNLDDTKITMADLNTANLSAATLAVFNANIDTLLAGYIKASDIVTGTITTQALLAGTATFLTAIADSLSASDIQSFQITSDHLVIANAFITNAMVESLSADKINTGSINTNLVTIRSTDGNTRFTGNSIIVEDDNDTVRVLIGKNSDNDYTLTLWDEDGTCIWDAEGIKRDAIKDAIIDDDCVADNANISASKLNISSLVTSLNSNGGIRTSAANIIVDADNQTLSTWFSTMNTWKTGIANRVSDVETDLTIINGQLSTFASQSDLTTLQTTVNGQATTIQQLSTDYTNLEQTTTGLSGTISSMQTTMNTFVTQSDVDDAIDDALGDLDLDDISDLDQRVTTVESNVTSLQATATSLSSSVTSVQNSITELGEAVDDIEYDLDNSSFVAQSELESTLATYNSQVTQTASAIEASVTSSVTSTLANNYVTKTDFERWFTIDSSGLTIGSSSSPVKLEMSNDGIKFYDVSDSTNPVEIGFWDGDMFHSRNIKVDVTYSAQFGNFEWVPKSDGTLVLRRVSS